MSATSGSSDAADEDPELEADLIELAARLDSEPPGADAVPVLDLLRLASAVNHDRPIARLGKYTLQRWLGAGAYGAVWAATDPAGERVAIKIPHTHVLLQSELAERYAREIEVMSSLDAPGIVPVYGVCRAEGLVALVMAYCAGPSLATWLAARGLPAEPRLAATIVLDLARATATCHACGIVHGDIKPSNVLLFPAESTGEFPYRPKLADFGLAVLANEPRTGRESSLWRGTLEYMAPEQVRGDADARGFSTDIYSLGVVLYELLTGDPPFVGSRAGETLARVLEEPPASLRSHSLHIPLDLEQICVKCLAKDPGDRYHTAQGLADELLAFLEHRPVLARPRSWSSRWRRALRRPQRVNEAGLLTIAIHGALMTWMSIALAMQLAGSQWLPSHMTAGGLAAESAKMSALDVVVIFLALKMLARRRWAAALAGAAGGALAVMSLGNLTGWIQPPFDGVYGNDRRLQVVVFSLLTVLFTLQTVSCLLAWLSMGQQPTANSQRFRSWQWTVAAAVFLVAVFAAAWIWRTSRPAA